MDRVTRNEREAQRRMSRVGKLIREGRIAKGLSVERASKLLTGPAAPNTRMRAWFRWEAGERLPSLPRTVELADVLKIPLDGFAEAVRMKEYA